ncbi:glycoside hydrolase family 43 protein [Lactococcus kimchii]|uniref:glycoside hydrolase family 43 protein n=1 Tax=Lactococcus sp. S-13 TaxID=2507158 RepID=UPI00102337DE|nr:glycoside hydrolase family 43 protein [Lactococcus sp. S-13]RZI48083.1 glycoside hydrolase family 43 protein [Lactococcus sp. S-13]
MNQRKERVDSVFNPIIPGFSPDPSICRVVNDYYLCNSSFSYFPGLPIYHSTDLIHWEFLSFAINRSEQMDFSGGDTSRGLFAPTLRYHNGTFYIVCTNISHGGNFLIYSSNLKEWSDPVWLEADGIDPSLYFEKDKVYYCGTHAPNGAEMDGLNNRIFLAELDIKTGNLSNSTDIWQAVMRGAVWPEGPHIYRIKDYYYLLYAEGGTSTEHAVMVARSHELFGPYENCPHNPILTHRHLGPHFPLRNVGHGDLVDDSTENWWMVCLASRFRENADNMGRETFLVKIEFISGWPYACLGKGMLSEQTRGERIIVDFNKSSELLQLKTTNQEWWSLKDDKWILDGGTEVGSDGPHLLVIRQQSFDFELEASVNVSSDAGLILYQNEENYLTYTEREIEIVKAARVEKILSSSRNPFLRINVKNQIATFNGENPINISFLGSTQAGGFVGTMIGIFNRGDARAIFCNIKAQFDI